MTGRDSLSRWAGLPGPTKVLAAARRRLEAGHGMARGALAVQLTLEERKQVGQLLGTRWVLSEQAVTAKGLLNALEAVGADLTELLVTTGGPLRHLPTERQTGQATALAERDHALDALTSAGVAADDARNWLTGKHSPRAGSGRLLPLAENIAAVWDRLPAPGETNLLPVLAAEALDDPHALDRGSATASAVLRLAFGEPATDAETWRTAWEELGVICDPVSSRVLVLNLALSGSAPACVLANAVPGEPTWLTWRSLTGSFAGTDTEVYVCENPAVTVAAADAHGQDCRPLICTNGRPSGAAKRLLKGLAESGVHLHLRADDDPAGQSIVADLAALLPGASLWRYRIRTTDEALEGPRYEEQDLAVLIADLGPPDGEEQIGRYID